VRRSVARAFAAVPALGLALATACSGDVIGGFPSPPTPLITASPSASPQGRDGVLAEIAVEGSPCFLAEAGGRIWVTSFDANELTEIDPRTNRIVRVYPMPDGPCGMVGVGDVLWVQSANGTLVRFDARRGRELERLRVGRGVVGLVSAPSGLWGLEQGTNDVVHLDPTSGDVIGRVPIEPPLAGIAAQGDRIWTVSGREAVVRIDPRTHAIADRIVIERFEPEGVAIDGPILWISSSFEGTLVRVDTRTGKVLDRIPTDGPLFGGVVLGDSFWASGNDGTLFRLDAESGDVLERRDLLGFGPIPAAGNLWTVDFLSDAVYRLDDPAP
jgi:outer membrane protein assembly factor BamB